MNVEAMLEVVRQVKRRIAQGDYPTIPAYRVSTLEEVIFDLDHENERLNMEMAAYRENLTPKDVEAMTAVIKALNDEKTARTQSNPGVGK
jgi:hypothetical protein